MTKDLRGRSSFGRRLYEARKASGLTQMQAAKALGISQGTLSQAEREGETSGLVAKYAALYRVSPLWLTDESEEMQQNASAVAHLASEPREIVAVPTITWEGLMGADLAGRFEVELPNDALAPDFPKGTVMRFDATKPRRAGWPCLVKDEAGQFYARDYEEGPAGAWRAVARSRGFSPLESSGLVYVATMYGVDFL